MPGGRGWRVVGAVEDAATPSASVGDMTATAAGAFRRTAIERSDQAFFAAGACHILAWACRGFYPSRSIGIGGMRRPGELQVFHVYATWDGRAFDHAGWNLEDHLLLVNAEFEGRRLDRVEITSGLAEFCEMHYFPYAEPGLARPTPACS